MGPKIEGERKRVHKGTAGMSLDEKMERNRASNRRSNLSRVRIGEHLERWNRIKKQFGLRTDVDMAKMLLDGFEAVQAAKQCVSSVGTSTTSQSAIHGGGIGEVQQQEPEPQLITSGTSTSTSTASNEVFDAVQTWKQHIVSFGESPTLQGSIPNAHSENSSTVQATQQHIVSLGITTSLHGTTTVNNASKSDPVHGWTQHTYPLDTSTSLQCTTSGEVTGGDPGNVVPNDETLTDPSLPNTEPSISSSSSKLRQAEEICCVPSYKSQNLLAVIARLPTLQKAKTKDERL